MAQYFNADDTTWTLLGFGMALVQRSECKRIQCVNLKLFEQRHSRRQDRPEDVGDASPLAPRHRGLEFNAIYDRDGATKGRALFLAEEEASLGKSGTPTNDHPNAFEGLFTKMNR
ncbi:hypothetical protein NCHU2750_54770 (plasmid) [Neorhizobium sp. NCHU2750]|nr:hypothetical protein NCHU2750_54770 [Neorhizobium sp. NCHU2750]